MKNEGIKGQQIYWTTWKAKIKKPQQVANGSDHPPTHHANVLSKRIVCNKRKSRIFFYEQSKTNRFLEHGEKYWLKQWKDTNFSWTIIFYRIIRDSYFPKYGLIVVTRYRKIEEWKFLTIIINFSYLL